MNNFVIVFGMVIENVMGGLNNDIINGNEVKNVFYGLDGNDIL